MSSSSMSFTNRRQLWPNHNQQHPFRKHKSLHIDSSYRAVSASTINTRTSASATTTTTASANNFINDQTINGVNLLRINNFNNNSCSSNRTKFSIIKKQTSVDQILNNNNNSNNQESKQYQFNNCNKNSSYNNTNNNNNNNNTSTTNNTNNSNFYNTSQDYNEINLSKSDNLTLYNSESSEVNNDNVNTFQSQGILVSKNFLKNAFKSEKSDTINSEINALTSASEYYAKRKPQLSRYNSSRSYGDNKKEKSFGSDNSIRKGSKNSAEDKLNLNIFLSQNIISSDFDDDNNSSDDQDNSSASNKTVKSIEVKEIENNSNTDSKNEQIENKSSNPLIPNKLSGNYCSIRKPLTAATRRALFRASKDSSILNYSTSFSPPGYQDPIFSEIPKPDQKSQITENKINSSNILKNGNIITNKRPPSGVTRVPSASILTSRSRVTSAKKSTVRIPSANNNNRVSSAKRNNIIQSSQGQKGTSISNNSNTNIAISEISAAPSLIIERRPPLIRAMSAPIRTLDENSKNILANKRKPRRRKILTRTQTTCFNDINNGSNNDDNKLIESADNCDDDDENFIGRNRNRKNTTNNTLIRSRSTIGIDVVTLVSLISSEESDSEKEDLLSPVTGSPVKRAPPLRKSGKSVSFQENQGPNTTREYTHMLRRGSIAPLAAKLRSNRPPTAPPVSIFMSEFEQNSPKMDEKSKSCSREDDITSTQSTDETKENSCLNKNTEEETFQYPEFVKTLKERECWKLFQTMTNKGVAVSYETVLRGLLTPTELRQLLSKRKELEMAQQRQQDIEHVPHDEGVKKNLKNKSNN